MTENKYENSGVEIVSKDTLYIVGTGLINRLVMRVFGTYVQVIRYNRDNDHILVFVRTQMGEMALDQVWDFIRDRF